MRVWEMRAGVGDDIEPWRRRLVVPSVCQAARNVGAVGIDLGLVKNRSVEASNPGDFVWLCRRTVRRRATSALSASICGWSRIGRWKCRIPVALSASIFAKRCIVSPG